ncbi:MAG: methyltransferase domain-containing protein [Gemmatimonadota bacterium]
MNASYARPLAAGAIPSMLDLVRLSRRTLFPPGGKELYHQIALLTELSQGNELLVAACGQGTTLTYFVEEFGAQGEGVDEDPELVEAAVARAKAKGLGERLHFQCGSMEDLPYRDGVFDVAVGEIGLTASADPETAVTELVRVTKPGGRIVLVQLVWKAPVDPRRQTVLSRHLGARPLMLVELKKILRAAGVERLHTEAWSDEDTAFRSHLTKPFPDFAEMFTLGEKIGILRRAWRRWGWRGVQAALAREREVHRLLTRERVLGLDLITGWKTAGANDGEPAEAGAPHAETVDLPLFLQSGER